MRRSFCLIAALMLLVSGVASAQGGRNVDRDSLNRVTMADYEDMKAKIGVRETKPRRDGQAEDPALRPNYDELKANPFPFYPDPFVTFDGRKVRNARMWYKVRKPELKEVFEREVYGRIPDNVPAVDWEVVREYDEGWVDMNGSFISAAKASPIYEFLGLKGLGTDLFPGVNVLLDGDIAFRQHTGGHEAGPNWPYFLDFFAKYL